MSRGTMYFQTTSFEGAVSQIEPRKPLASSVLPLASRCVPETIGEKKSSFFGVVKVQSGRSGPNGLPVGVQLVCRRHDDARLLEVGLWVEHRLGQGDRP